MQVLKVFDTQWCDDFIGIPEFDNSTIKPFKVLDMIRANDCARSFTIDTALEILESYDDTEDEEYKEIRLAYQWIVDNLRRTCPEIRDDEEVIIKIWW